MAKHMAKRTNHHDALTLIKQDHTEVKELFDKFEDSDDPKEQYELAQKAIALLKVHAKFEEELFYPAIRAALANGVNETLEEADEEHHVAKQLIAELEQMKGTEENYHAKFIVLSENVRHHKKEEESEVFPLAHKAKIDLQALGEQIAARKRELMADGVPPDFEAEAVNKVGLQRESPAKQAARTFRIPSLA